MYSQPVSETLGQPALFMFVVDQSGSMAEPWAGTGTLKMNQVSDVINRTIESLITQCSYGERMKNYFDVACVCYGGTGIIAQFDVQGLPMTAAELKGKAKWEKRWRKVSDGAGGLVEIEADFPVWLTPDANGGTPMAAGLRQAARVVGQWAQQHQNSFPPIAINVTDGQPADPRDAEAAADEIKRVVTTDGQALLLNCHISETAGKPIMFPNTDRDLPDEFSRLLFRMSSVLPDVMVAAARRLEYNVQPGARAFVYNADPIALIEFLDIGTPLNQLLLPGE